MPQISREAGVIGSEWGREITQSKVFNEQLEGLIQKYELEKLNPASPDGKYNPLLPLPGMKANEEDITGGVSMDPLFQRGSGVIWGSWFCSTKKGFVPLTVDEPPCLKQTPLIPLVRGNY